MATPDLTAVLQPFAPLDDGDGPQRPERLTVSPLAGGLINDTFALGRGFVLQRLHPIFRPTVNLDIAALTPVLRSAGVPVPEIVAAGDGRPWVEIADPEHPLCGAWRILTRLPGTTLHRLANREQARAAGAMVARFHAALRGSSHAFHFSRPGAHDTARHLRLLGEALADHPDHRLEAPVRALATELQARWQAWGALPTLPERVIHGDLKVSNLLFAGDAVVGVIDLDTMARGTLDVELGDALRSWCNAAAEDDPAPRFLPDVCEAALAGYLTVAGDWLTVSERRAILPGVERICLELAARFAADALSETYFGWDPQRFATRGDHNLIRARNQLGLARDVATVRRANPIPL